jgi:hypothetical protein
MPSDDLQHIVDAVAAKLSRSVSVDDPSMRLLAASRHFGDQDPARVRSVLDRYAGEEATGFVLSHGISKWTGPGRVPAHRPQLVARMCVPVRCHGLLLGYLWLIDKDHTVTDDELALAVDAADEMGLVLYRRLLLHEREQARTGALLRDLVSADQVARVRAIEEIRDDGLLAAADHVVVICAEAFGGKEAKEAEQATVALGTAVEAAIRTVPAGTVLGFAHGRRAMLVLATAAVPAAVTVEGLADVTASRFRSLAGPHDRLVVGVGSDQPGLGRAAVSYGHAGTAARAARLLPGVGAIAHWARLGPYAMLLQLPRDQVMSEEWTPALRRLRRADPDGALVATVEAYLDCAGDVQRTARRLRVHRTTLYHRVQRIEEVAGVDLHNGDDRLALHLGLRLARLSAAWRADPDG